MKKELLIFGSNGALGKGVTSVLEGKNYDKIYLFDFHPGEGIISENIVRIKIEDLSIEKNIKRAFAEVNAAKDSAFFLFSTVGGFVGGKKIWETEMDDWSGMMNMNLTTSFLISKYFARLVKDSHSGSICFTSAFVGTDAEIGKAAYGASKSALIHLVDTLAKEGNEIKLSANAIAPYVIDTPANREWMKTGEYTDWIKPSEIGELVYNIFNSYNFFTGNILKLKGRVSLD
jgi:NAD(P)-dependent dehydrogenase (short-subunit alcohol dehydrogenase family)